MVYKKLAHCDRTFDDTRIDTERMIDNNHSSHNVFIVCLIFSIDVSTLLKNHNMAFFIAHSILHVLRSLYSKMRYKNALE